VRLDHELDVPVGVAEAWPVLQDVRRVAACMPGARLHDVDGPAFTGEVSIKVGPISMAYQGEGRFEELDEQAGRAVLRLNGREQRGSGSVSATIEAVLRPNGAGSRLALHTDVSLTGRAAQLGAGAIRDVSDRVMAQFADELAAQLAGPGQPREAGAARAPRHSSGARRGRPGPGRC